jgi:hypothetical protein
MPDTPVAPQGGGPYDPVMEARVSRLEEDMRDAKAAHSPVEAAVIEIRAILPHLATKADFAALPSLATKADLAVLPSLATKADVAELRSEFERRMSRVERELSDKPSKIYRWAILGVLLAAYACGLAGLAVLK